MLHADSRPKNCTRAKNIQGADTKTPWPHDPLDPKDVGLAPLFCRVRHLTCCFPKFPVSRPHQSPPTSPEVARRHATLDLLSVCGPRRRRRRRRRSDFLSRGVSDAGRGASILCLLSNYSTAGRRTRRFVASRAAGRAHRGRAVRP